MLIPANRPFPIVVTESETELFMGVRVFDLSTGSPVQITGQEGQENGVYPMAAVADGLSYQALFTGSNQKPYLFLINGYTDDTYATINGSIAEQSIGAFCTTLSPIIVQRLGIFIGCQDQPRQHPVVVAQNSDLNLLLTFVDEHGHPIDCSTATQVEISFLEADNETVLSKSLTGGQITRVEGSMNQFLVAMLAADVELLPPGDNDAQVELVMGGNTFNVNCYACVSVQPVAT